MKEILVYVAGFLPPTALLVWIGTHPNIAEKWAALLARAVSHIPGLVRAGSKGYVKYDTQRRLNYMTRALSLEGPFLTFERAEVKWVDGNSDLGALAAEGRVIVRLNSEEQQDRGFIRVALCFVNESLLRSAKKCLSPSQRTGLDLFVVRSILRATHPDLVEIFDEEFVGEHERDSLTTYHKKFSQLEARGLMWDVLLQELVLLGQRSRFEVEKVDYHEQAEELIDFLVAQSKRSIGELVNCEHLSTVFRLALIYVGMQHKKAKRGAVTWINYVKGRVS